MEYLRVIFENVPSTGLVFDVPTLTLTSIYKDNTIASIENLNCIYINRPLLGSNLGNHRFGLEAIGSSLGQLFPSAPPLTGQMGEYNVALKNTILEVIRSKQAKSFENNELCSIRIFSLTENSRGELLCLLFSDVYNSNAKVWRNKNDFLAAVSQELRTPLNGIIGMSDLMIDTPLTQDQLDYIDTIRQCSFSLMSTLNDMLDYSKLELNSMKLENHPFSLRECIETSLEILHAKADERNIETNLIIESDVPPFIRGDKQRLQQILINLVSNAIKYTETKPGKQGRISVTVKSRKAPDTLPRSNTSTNGKIERKNNSGEVHDRLKGRTDSARNTREGKRRNEEESSPRETRYEITFLVTDNGVGIDKKVQSRLFTNLLPIISSEEHSLQSLRSSQHTGAGLGLAITRHLVLLMGGTIRVESEPGLGSTFSFTISTTECTEGTGTIADTGRDSLVGKSILIVDGNAQTRLALTNMLLRWKMKPTGCSSPDEALIYFKNNYSFDAALIDISSPNSSSPGPTTSIAGFTRVSANPLPVGTSSNLTAGQSIPRSGSKTDGVLLAEQIRNAGVDIPLVALMNDDSEGRMTRYVNKTLFKTYLLKLTKETQGRPPIGENKLFNVCVDIFGPQHLRSSGKSLEGTTRPHPDIQILSAEDLPTNQKVIKSMLSRLGYNNVDFTSDGVETLKAVEKKKYDLILLDVKMPKKDGYTVAREIYRTYKKESRPYIIGCTANVGQSEKERYAKYMDVFLAKPIFIENLEKVLHRMAVKRRGSRIESKS